MIRLALKVVLAAAAVWAVWAFVPVKGRTMADRWRTAGSLPVFIERGWAEVTSPPRPKPAAKPQARPKPVPTQRPTEGHTEADRRAVDRILADRVDARR